MMMRISTSWSAAATGDCGDSEISNWLAPYSGMELFDRDAGTGRRVDDVADEPLELEHPGQAVLRPQM